MIIEKITSDGIQYVNHSGESVFLSFKECNENWINYQKKTKFLDDDQVSSLRGKQKVVGQRDVSTESSFIEFFTRPFVRFEFSLPDQMNEYRNLRDSIISFGWTTHDLS